ncbi:DUF4124 domain-containing protein [Thiocapsa roseopersicina]|uniref:DUF4124 domain-containing protein n=1 Tax=Thiocapsa roseopersicina TaxID=1058 RepID=A0A1H2ZE40_THIRO|nr:DUF4124 domain-containing protein [Thiocapsa roseopersicina]SDX15597.1 protein of unknown function [Thiocapsa roseopersicina]
MIKYLFVVLVFFAPQGSSAEIFRWVDADGRTHFSDRRPPDAAVQRVVPDTGPAGDSAPKGAAPAGDEPFLGPYAAFDILAPTTGAVLIQPTDILDVQLLLEPPLLDGHRLDLVLDDRAVAIEAGSTGFQIQGVGFQAHRIQARVLNALGTVVASTQLLDVELRQSAPPGALP